MRIIRYQINKGTPTYGWMLDDKIGKIEGDVFGSYKRTEAQTPLSDAKLLPPSQPTKIVCVGRNYRRHAEELGNEVPEEPLIFLKPPSALRQPGEPIVLPPQSDNVHHEAELAVVIGRRASRTGRAEAGDYIAGYTCANDVTARDLQRADKTFTRGKGFEFSPRHGWRAGCYHRQP